MKLNRFTSPLWDLDTFHVYNDFEEDQSDLRAIDTVTDSGSVAVGDAANGIALLTPSDGSVVDNDEVYLATPNELFQFADGRPIYGRFRFAVTEVASGIVNFCVGFQNAVGADSLVDDGAGPKVSGDTLAVGKVDGETVWRVWSASSGATTTTKTNLTVSTGATVFHVVEIHCGDWDGVSCQVSFMVNGEYLRDTSNRIIYHTVAISGSELMQMFAGVKLGANTNNDTMLLDFWYGAQRRA